MAGDAVDVPSHAILQPHCHLTHVDIERRQFEFVKLSREDYSQSTFLDQRMDMGGRGQFSIAIEAARDILQNHESPVADRRVNYIFHTAFCCSTLLARALDIDGKSLSFKEPRIFTEMANFKRYGQAAVQNATEWQRLFDLVVRLLAKPFKPTATALIKPTNTANNLLEDVLRQPATGGILLLYSSLESFLISVLKKGESCRRFVRSLFNVVSCDTDQLSNFSWPEMASMTDMQIAALAWNIQIDHYLRILASFPAANIRTLNCDTLLADPATTLRRLADLMSYDLSDTEVHAIVSGPDFARDSKNEDRDYDAAIRAQEYEHVRARHRETIEVILEWSRQARPDNQIPQQLPCPL